MRQRAVVVVDFSWTDRFAREAALATARHLAAHGIELSLTAFAGYDSDAVREAKARKFRGYTVYHKADLPDVLQTLEEDYHCLVAEFAQSCASSHIPCDTEIADTQPAKRLIDLAEIHDWVAVPRDLRFRKGEGLVEGEVDPGGDVLADLVREIAVPVLIGPSSARGSALSGTAMVAYDGSEGASRILHSICALGIADGMHFDVLTVAGDEAVAGRLAERATTVLTAHGGETTSFAIESSQHAANFILEHARAGQHAFLAIGAFGARTWRERIFGSVTELLLKECPCPIFLQR